MDASFSPILSGPANAQIVLENTVGEPHFLFLEMNLSLLHTPPLEVKDGP